MLFRGRQRRLDRDIPPLWARFTRDGEEFTDLSAAFDGGTGRLVTVDHDITVDGINAAQRCVALLFAGTGDGAITLRATGTYRDQLIYERGGS